MMASFSSPMRGAPHSGEEKRDASGRWISAVVIVSANAEWRAVQAAFPEVERNRSPYGEWFELKLRERLVVFFQGGWGKVSAAASAQYALDRWQPELLINLGTCGGFRGKISRGEVILVEETLIYDIVEKMNPDPHAAIKHYAVRLDLSWLQPRCTQPVRRGLLVSADRDICPEDIDGLVEAYGACAADWESGAIAWVAERNQARCLILRGVSDLVGPDGGEAYVETGFFDESARTVMAGLLANLPGWLDASFASEG